MYARQIEGEEFTFGVSGKLIRNVLVMYDRQTDSYWSQLLGEAVEGEMIGTKLEFLPSIMTTWAQWRDTHPHTLALEKRTPGKQDTYDGYYQSSSTGVIGETRFDDRLYAKEFVIGVEMPDLAIAFPFGVLNDEPVVNYSHGETNILVFFDTNSGAGTVFDRHLGDQILTFSAGTENLTVIDAETGTVWDAFSGQAISGPLGGESLTVIKSTPVFWFGWKDFHSETEIYGLDQLESGLLFLTGGGEPRLKPRAPTGQIQ